MFICITIYVIRKSLWTQECKEMKVNYFEGAIYIFIGADIAYKLFTRHRRDLNFD